MASLARLTPLRDLTRPRRAAEDGFSAAEMMAVVAIIGIMVMITAPSMLNFFNSMKVRTAANKVMSHMRLCRQMSVSRRTDVILEIQAEGTSTSPFYRAWEERNGNMTREANGADGTANTEDDERWVLQKETQFVIDKVKFPEVYDDDTPGTMAPPGSSVLDSNKVVILRFRPNGQVARLATDTGVATPFTLLRIRLERQINGSRKDVWDATVNQAGKVGSSFDKATP